MQRLNLRNPKSYDYSGETDTLPARIRFYCISEGATEESYFKGIRNNRSALGIKNDVYIEIVPKEKGQETLSHPLQLVNACLYSMGCIDEAGKEIPQEKRELNCIWENYDPEQDIVCVIFDRDYKKLENSLDEIFRLCYRYDIHIIMSNPNFELWLLMHFPDIKKYDKNMLLENKKNLRQKIVSNASMKKRYLEILVSQHCAGYRKGGKLKFERFQPYIDLAIEQSALFCNESEELCSELGTSVGKLIQDMRK